MGTEDPNTRESLADLEMRDDFLHRHIGPTAEQVARMLRALGIESLEALMDRVLPDDIRAQDPLALPATKNERTVLSTLRRMQGRNQVFISMIGMGYSGTVMPGVIRRNLLESPGWYTAYTPYQAEVSQGRLEALLNYQQMIMDLTGMEIANASMLDEGTAAAEAMTMSQRLAKGTASVYFVDRDCHPQTLAVVRTRARPLGITVEVGSPHQAFAQDRAGVECCGCLLQYPGSSGEVREFRALASALQARGALLTVAADLLSLTLLTPPGEQGADMVIGSTQRFGVPMGYGGPHAAYFATRDAFKRQLPGRIIGVSTDSQGNPALRMALQTREQHIRREKATSNICTAEALPAILAGMYAVYHGPQGLTTIAARIHRLTSLLALGLGRLGFTVVNQSWFDTLTVVVPSRARHIAARAREARINLRVVDADHLGISFDETTNREDLRAVWRIFATKADRVLGLDALDAEVLECIPDPLRRKSAFLTHPVFHAYHSETEMLRYLRHLAAKDIALDRAMIPLGSCTMKLNATTEMEGLSQRNLMAMHPFCPLEQAQGYQQLFEELEDMLCEITGFDAFSLQPNAGSQGEYTGLLTIRKYQEGRGEAGRDICLIPASAHGTNPASAALAGLQVVVVPCDLHGNVDVAALRALAAANEGRLAALMITYPSTHGVFEESFREICEVVHAHGGQVYMDGANMNALVGWCRPGEIGPDVAHINLHKTFCIPHGGGGPGAGPIGVRAHLAPYLPDHPVVGGVNPAAGPLGTVGTVASAPWGSASLYTISWAYITLMGGEGLRRATQVAILNANYIAKRLAPHYPVLYTGRNGMVAHECIIDLRAIKVASGITVEDVAKRLVDYGFHAPTVSFPVPDTLMIEPTESEGLVEIERFCNALIQIRREIEAVERLDADREDNLLKNAPHTHALLLADEWRLPYSKKAAFFPVPMVREDKFWPPVGRIDNIGGDRHLICTCPPIQSYEE